MNEEQIQAPNRSLDLSVTLHYSPTLVRRSVFAYLYHGFGIGSIVALTSLIATAVFLIITQPGSWLAGAISAIVALIIFLLIGLYLLHYRQGMAKLARMQQPHAILRLTESEFMASSQGGLFSTHWSTFTDLWQFSDFWLLIIGPGQFITLPLADLTKEAQAFIISHVNAPREPATQNKAT